jgi:Leucine-rich repeat (LRR) protein
LQNNALTALPANTFSGLLNLEALLLRSNQIATMEPGWDTGLDSLAFLLLEDNLLSSLPPGLFAKNLVALYVA